MEQSETVELYLCCAHESDVEKVRAWLLPDESRMRDRIRIGAQLPDPDLGARMLHALTHEITRRHKQSVVLCGSDIPNLSAATMLRALDTLSHHDLLLGPSQDGGFYLIGTRTTLPAALFDQVVWSTDSVHALTRRNASSLGISMAPAAALPSLRDIDYPNDLLDWLNQVEREDETDDRQALVATTRSMLRQRNDL